MNINKTKLKNGVTLIHTQKENEYFISMFVGVNAGSRDEDEGLFGVAHFLEHLVFHGSEEFTRKDINILPSRWGGSCNAYTDRHMTAYRVQGLKEFWKDVIKLNINLSLKPDFDLCTLETERKIVLEELGTSLDNIWWTIYDRVRSQAEAKGMRHEILGTTNTINNIKLSDIKDFHSKFYTLNNTTISICTNMDITTDMLIEEINKHVPNRNGVKEFSTPNFKLLDPKDEIIESQEKQNKMLVFYDSIIKPKDSIVASLFKDILVGSLSSRISSELREKRGICYMTGAYFDTYDVPSFIIEFSDIDKKDIIKSEIDRILMECLTDLSDIEISDAKMSIIGKVIRNFQKPITVADKTMQSSISELEIIGLDEYIDMIKNVTKGDIVDFINSMFVGKNVYEAVAYGKK